MAHELVLDAAVRNWVLIPLTLSVVLMMVLRQYITKARSNLLLSAAHNGCLEPSARGYFLPWVIVLSHPTCSQWSIVVPWAFHVMPDDGGQL